MFLSNSATCSPIQIDSRPAFSARLPKSLIILGVAWGDMNVAKTPTFMMVLLQLRRAACAMTSMASGWRERTLIVSAPQSSQAR